MIIIECKMKKKKQNKKTHNHPVFILSAHQSFELFPRHNGLAAISESFALNLIISVPLVTICSTIMQTKFLSCHNKINRVHFFAVRVCSNPCVGPFPRIKMSFLVLST